MNVRAHILVPPHFLVSTAFKKMRWKDEFRKWLPKLSNCTVDAMRLWLWCIACQRTKGQSCLVIIHVYIRGNDTTGCILVIL